MEAYIIIISAAITAIAIAYKIGKNIKDNANGMKVFPIIAKDGNYVLSFPIGISNSNNDGDIDPIYAEKVYLDVISINENDKETFEAILGVINFNLIIKEIINKETITQVEYLSENYLTNIVLIKCRVEIEPTINAEIEFDINKKITVKIL